MQNTDAELLLAKLSTEKIIELVRVTRNNYILEFLEGDAIQQFFSEHYHMPQLSTIKIEFLKRDLKMLLGSSVDLVHYASVIKEIKDSNVLEVAQPHQLFFNREFEGIFKKYIF